jgi:hypothetical protein
VVEISCVAVIPEHGKEASGKLAIAGSRLATPSQGLVVPLVFGVSS